MELLRYVIDTPVAGPRTTGFPNSLNWGLTPTENSLNYPHLNALLNQLAEWMDQKLVDPPAVAYLIARGHSRLPNHAFSTLFDRLLE